MLGFKTKKKPNPDASQLLATILVVYPIISTISYEPREGMIKLSFALKGQPPEEEFRQLAAKVVDSLESYHQLEGFYNARIEMQMEGVGETCFLHVKRDMATLSRGELSVLNSLIEEKFSDNLIYDEINGSADMEFILTQEERLDQILIMVRQMNIPDCLVGIRERERVVVYAR